MKNKFTYKVLRCTVLPLLLSALFFTSCSKGDSIQNPFVTVKNGQFMYEEKPYYYFGTNFWHGAYLGADLVEGDKERLLRELDLLKEHKITNLRIMASSEESAMEASVKPAFQSAPGVFNEDLFKGLDYLLVEMAKRDMKAVLALNNYWQWSGGMSQYVNWVTGEPIIDPDKTGDWDGFQKQSAQFYSNKDCNQLYRNYIKALVERTNSISGVKYKDDPTIMAWQLSNEPRPHPEAPDSQTLSAAYTNWVIETAGYIKSLDKNHLVSSGNEGLAGSRESVSLTLEPHKSANIDYLTFHIWPKNWGWYDASNPEETFKNAVENTKTYFATHLSFARELNKPIVLEEFGMERDGGAFSPDVKTSYRDNYLDLLFAAVVDSAKAGSPMAGLNFWAWGGEAKASHNDFIWRKGDSFMGDPPQEAQGLNSVFSTDSSTLKIFKKYNEEIEKLMVVE